MIECYNINHDEFASVDDLLREYPNINEEFRTTENAEEYTIWKHWKWAGLHVSKLICLKILVLKKIR